MTIKSNLKNYGLHDLSNLDFNFIQKVLIIILLQMISFVYSLKNNYVKK